MTTEQPKEEENKYLVRVRGLPWSTTTEEIATFLSECELKKGNDGIHLTMTRNGRPSGEAYIELASEEDVEKALKKHRQTMGKRYIEVFKSQHSEMYWNLNRSETSAFSEQSSDNVVRLRGLPFDCTRDDVHKFFEGLEIVNDGILLTSDYQGRNSGEAFVQFTNGANVDRALKKNNNKQSIGHRYIEIFRSSMMEAERHQYGYGGNNGGNAGSMGGPRGGGGGGGGAMRFNPTGRRGRPGPYDRSPRGGASGMGASRGGYNNYGGMGGDDGQQQQYRGGYNEEAYYGFGREGRGGGGGGGMMEGGYGGGGGTIGGAPLPGGPPRYVVHMRGLPFRVTKSDIAEWFGPIVDPIDVYIIYNFAGKPAGEADVFFASEEDARKAMTKDRHNMQHRYVELFYDGPSGGRAGGGIGGAHGGQRGGGGGMGPGNNAGNNVPNMGHMGYRSEPVQPTGFSSNNNNNNNGYSTY
eukprot:TRINITY_DN2671_c0_g6_i1.p1 TRINITY_DN2671_c0_g6~~TRINITY_DN2671_c0_g6_i1.p1  ORF type:complete len:467 (+),score=132.32 TRINITY_DN2671_c0_g6_i1:76-1476(+)